MQNHQVDYAQVNLCLCSCKCRQLWEQKLQASDYLDRHFAAMQDHQVDNAKAHLCLFLQVPTSSDHEVSTVTLDGVGHASISYIKRRPRIDIIHSGSGSRRWMD
ncbi:hypothetical protein MRX96_002142 [Rhipicephalus microplus]